MVLILLGRTINRMDDPDVSEINGSPALHGLSQSRQSAHPLTGIEYRMKGGKVTISKVCVPGRADVMGVDGQWGSPRTDRREPDEQKKRDTEIERSSERCSYSYRLKYYQDPPTTTTTGRTLGSEWARNKTPSPSTVTTKAPMLPLEMFPLEA